MTDAIRGVTGTGPSEGISPAAGSKTSQVSGDASPSPSVAASNDLADVSQTQSLLETINAATEAVPNVNAGNVAGIREAIANGTYQVDPQQIAKQLLNSDQVLPIPTSGNE